MNLLLVNEEEKSLFSTRLYIFSPDNDNEKRKVVYHLECLEGTKNQVIIYLNPSMDITMLKEKLDNVDYDVVITVAHMLLKRRTYDEKLLEFKFQKASVSHDEFSLRIRIGNGLHTRFWKDLWIGDCILSGLFPRMFALDAVKDISVAGKLQSPLVSSFRRNVRGGIEEQQLEHLVALLDYVILSNSNDRWVSDLNGDGVFRVKDVRNLLDEFFLPRADVRTRWVKNIPIKVNIFAWRLALDRLPTRANLVQRNVVTESQSCPLCDAILEDTSHLFFNCSLPRDVTRLLCRWWNLGVQTFSSYAEWLVWFNTVRLAPNLKVILEGKYCCSSRADYKELDFEKKDGCNENKNGNIGGNRLHVGTHSMEVDMLEEDDMEVDMLEEDDMDVDMFEEDDMDVDMSEQVYYGKGHCLDIEIHKEIIESVIGINKDDIDEEDDESSTMEPPSRNEAIKAAITLNNFLLNYEKTTPEVLTMLRKIRDEIQGEIDFNKKQKTIESFFKKPS
nr:RNA-directed DNA polymerase, eukaryota [Tanacetum cinerariifolium]